ncbi:NTP pyrophosphohydrolase [Sanguibacter keddieii DSM 10542]|uniref:NTP pyrophosphohydrolase n=1 Tax=Sanguibacter keddieii (strain ATCC 51767 / DSM 10542 / NCFB 3025 / ST-74) TaxID=446469 RepID=D1BF37_SANKS|nr:NTP pyrophosphohydrolase [Sanguibacter keddieii DSM 10542]
MVLAEQLASWAPRSPHLATLRVEYLAYLADGGTATRDASPQHLTASTFVLSPDLRQVLLCFHRKGQFWVQVGGHVEPGDSDVAAAAAREAHEESGLVDLGLLRRTPVDLDRHGLGDAFGRCAVHWDVGYVALVPADSVPVVSEESDDVAWWPVDALPAEVPPQLHGRLARVLAELTDLTGA